MKFSVSSIVVAILFGVPSTSNADIVMEDFASLKHNWVPATDDVIPGGSSVVKYVNTGYETDFYGTVKYQPFIGGPGFAKITATDSFPDISNCEAIEITLENFSNYYSYYVAFGTVPPNDKYPIPSEWRATFFSLPTNKVSVTIELNKFSNDWNLGTGKITTPCSADPSVCPTPAALSNIQFMEIWAQGVEGYFELHLFSIKGVGGC